MPGKEDSYPQRRQKSVPTVESDPNHWSSALRCTICLEFFRDPRCLPCGHTFCKVCIEEIIDHVRRWQMDRPRKVLIFSCPHCRRQIHEAQYNKYSSKNVVVEGILEGWKLSVERQNLSTMKVDYGTQTELGTTDSWVQTDLCPSNIAIKPYKLSSATTGNDDTQGKTSRFNILSQLQEIGTQLMNHLPFSKQICPTTSSCPVSVEEALYSLQDNLLPGDNFTLGEYQLVTLPVCNPSAEGMKSLKETLNRMFE